MHWSSFFFADENAEEESFSSLLQSFFIICKKSLSLGAFKYKYTYIYLLRMVMNMFACIHEEETKINASS